tara:strand:- start:464 stop:1366 length:903 start_codon:yes stop_codon:yes gene_type:complete
MEPKLSYTLSDFQKIQNDGFSITLPDNILSIISQISAQVGAANYVKTPQFHSRQRYNKRKQEEDWGAIRNFKVTERVEKTGVEKVMQELRGELNKVTEKNYETISAKLFEKMTDDLVDNNKSEIAKHIFEIASTNKFYSKVYARLFNEIIKRFDFMRDIMINNFNIFMEVFDTIDSADPNTDYDKFCNVNKANEKRKALSQFFVNLMLEGLIDKNAIMNIINSLFKKMFDFAELKDKKAEGVEISENLFILVTSIKSKLEQPEIDSIKEKLDLIVAMKPSPKNSLTNKIIFKYMDLIELL